MEMYHQHQNFQQMTESQHPHQNLTGHDFTFQNFDPSLTLDLPIHHFSSHVPMSESDMHLVSNEVSFNNVSISSIPVEVDNILFSNQPQMHTVMQPSYQLQVVKESYMQQQQFSQHQVQQNQSQLLPNDVQLYQQMETSFERKAQTDRKKVKKRSEKNEKKIICGICGKQYVSLSGLTKHTQRVHNTILFANDNTAVDPNSFPQKKSSLTDEKSIQFKTVPPDFQFGGSSRSHKCSECGNAFSSPHVLRMHKTTHSNTEKIPCDVCQETINMMDIPSHFMAKHVIVRNPNDAQIQDQKFVCAICLKSYKMKKDIQKHVTKHSTIRPWKCDFCSEAFQSFASLSEHLRTHAVRTLKCRYCDKYFKTHSVRSKHEKTIHQGERMHLAKNFHCEKCEKSFTCNAKLVNHSYTHLGIKPHKCYICSNKRYSHERDLRTHMRKYHPEFKVIKRKGKEPLLIGPEDKPWALVTRTIGTRPGDKMDPGRKGKNKPFKCGKCRLSFVTQRGLELHTRFHKYSSSAQCQICRSNIEIILHMNHFLIDHTSYEETVNNGKITSRIFTCNVCNYKCYKKKNMQKHFVNHSDVRPWECDQCTAKFSLLEYLLDHERIHEVGKLLCRTCNKSFKTHTLRSRHERVVHQGKKPNKKFLCPVCGKQFESQCKVNIHMAGHTGEKNFKCKICKKKEYTYKDDLRKHMKRFHADALAEKADNEAKKSKAVRCENAPVGFTARADLPQYTAPEQMAPPGGDTQLVNHMDILLEAAQTNNLLPASFL